MGVGVCCFCLVVVALLCCVRVCVGVCVVCVCVWVFVLFVCLKCVCACVRACVRTCVSCRVFSKPSQLLCTVHEQARRMQPPDRVVPSPDYQLVQLQERPQA
eukprot:m.5664 g.5664  ORF g.5664 m.5664 type:complete len:102 (-) comp2433_c0_seq1:243-548(-)